MPDNVTFEPIQNIEFENKLFDNLSEQFYTDLKQWLSLEGLKYFTEHKDNLISLHILGGGMQVRNWMRSYNETKEWDCHSLDNLWIRIIEKVITNEI